MYKALVCCRAGMGSSMLLKIKADQVINENESKTGRVPCYQTVILFLNEYGGASGADRDFMLGEKI